MKNFAKKQIKKLLDLLLTQMGFAIMQTGVTSSTLHGYISAAETVFGAEKEGLSVCDFVEKKWGQQGETQKVIDQMVLSGAIIITNPNVLEIGTGTGRYLEKLLHISNPAKYESYETAKDWADWLKSKYPIISHEADGISFKQTPNYSIDLLHAHGVFVYLPFLVSYRYWKEIWRVVRLGGYVVFDIYSEDCLDESTVEKWLKSEQYYPCFLSKSYVISIFIKHGFSYSNSFMNRHGEGLSEYLIFRKMSEQ